MPFTLPVPKPPPHSSQQPPFSHGDPYTRHSSAPRPLPGLTRVFCHRCNSGPRSGFRQQAPTCPRLGARRLSPEGGAEGPGGRSFLPVPPAAPDGRAGAHDLPAMPAMTTSRETLHLVTSRGLGDSPLHGGPRAPSCPLHRTRGLRHTPTPAAACPACQPSGRGPGRPTAHLKARPDLLFRFRSSSSWLSGGMSLRQRTGQ